jgi:hypothetical protein
MDRKEKEVILANYAKQLANNELSNYQYALWITNYNEFEAKAFCKIYNELENRDVPFHLWIGLLVAG